MEVNNSTPLKEEAQQVSPLLLEQLMRMLSANRENVKNEGYRKLQNLMRKYYYNGG